MTRLARRMAAAIFLLVLIFGIFCGCASAPEQAGEVVPYDLSPRAVVDDEITLKVNGKEIPVEHYLSARYARFALLGKGKIEVSFACEYENVQVYPLRLGLNNEVKKDTLTFTLQEPQNIMIQFGKSDSVLMLFIDKAVPSLTEEEKAGAMIAADFGFDLTGKTDDTEKFQQMLQEFKESDRDILYFGKGIYSAKTYVLDGIENKTFFFEPGAFLDMFMPSGPEENKPGMEIKNCKGLKILGAGMLDSKGKEIRETFGPIRNGFNARGVQMGRIENVLIDGLVIKGSRNSSLLCEDGASRDLTIKNVRIVAPKEITYEWLDGINLTSVKNVRIEDCMVFTNDDCFASGHYFGSGVEDKIPSENFYVKNMIGYTTLAGGIRLGYQAFYDMLGYTFEQCEFYGYTTSYLYIEELLEDNRYDDIVVQDTVIKIEPSQGYFVEFIGNPKIDNIIFKDVKFYGEKLFKVRQGCTVTFENCYMNDVRIDSGNCEDFFVKFPTETLEIVCK